MKLILLSLLAVCLAAPFDSENTHELDNNHHQPNGKMRRSVFTPRGSASSRSMALREAFIRRLEAQEIEAGTSSGTDGRMINLNSAQNEVSEPIAQGSTSERGRIKESRI
jgi:hypothetical protein